ncbi:hypothetical protein P167DRAFT_534622 [Morchella conica CCBAS932]|uniref:DUF676 domain-containing protein n=1 Tax=Morchella conica CCBAS932 TaxID=1392247 RepID=A0A3N4KX19_9PEZI|nr:hypothetical protein P167DRAFT_534622 [Morchella conica CCBAS932]
MSTLRIRRIPETITKDYLSELYPGCAISLCRTGCGKVDKTQTATVTFKNESAVKDIIRNKPLFIDKKKVVVDDEFNALTVLHSDPKACVDIIAVHGLGGHAFRSWTFRGPGSNGAGAMWLRDFLPDEISQSRIMTYGYNSDILDTDSVAGIRAYGLSLLNIINDMRTTSKEKKRPIIFICHSLGGIVVKEALNRARVHNYQDIVGPTIGIVFLSTPHQGTSLAQYGSIIGVIAAIQGLNRKLISDLEQNSDRLTEIAEDFIRYQSSILFASFYERRKTSLFGGFWGYWYGSKLLVDQLSSTLGVLGEKRDPLDKDHMSICKFEHQEDIGYRTVVKRIREIMGGRTKMQMEGSYQVSSSKDLKEGLLSRQETTKSPNELQSIDLEISVQKMTYEETN